MSRRTLAAVTLLVSALAPQLAPAHSERPTPAPPRAGAVPDPDRVPTQVLDVCKTGECAFTDIQAAVNAAPGGALIRIWPGYYEELPSRAAPDLPPDNPDGTYSFEFQQAHPNAINLVAVVGKSNVTLRGMGHSPDDVVIDAAFAKHVGIRGDRADGLVLQNFSFYHALEHGVYVLDQSGFLIDDIKSYYSQEYSFLMFATDRGLIRDCEAVGAGDGGIYPGGQADVPGGLGRPSVEVSHCVSHHNVLGYSGTQGDNVFVHDTLFYDNAVGLVSDSETDHPNYPENNLTLENNRIFDNDFDVYAPDSDVQAVEFDEAGAGFSGAALPVGVGVFLPSGNDNLVRDNDIWGNSRFGVWLASGQGLVVGPTSEPPADPFASSGNRFVGNRLFPPEGIGTYNGIDFGWDGMGLGNCWQDNTRGAGGGATGDTFLPPCDPAVPAGILNASNAIQQAGLAKYDGVPLCAHLGLEPCSWGPGPAQPARNTPNGYVAPPMPAPCGPSTCT